MNSLIINTSSLAPPKLATPCLKATANEKKLATLMSSVIDQKQTLVDASLKGRVNALEGIMIGGDLFSMGYLAFQGVQLLKPSLAAVPAIGMATLVCGEIAGAVNIGVALICLKEGIQALKNGDNKLATRLFIDFVSFTAIGAIMILTSLATKVAALGAIGLFFAANPWLLPVIFFAVSIPVLIEVSNRIKNIWTSKDLASQLKTDDLQKLIQGTDENNPFHLQPLLNGKETEIKAKLSRKMEQLQADMGVEAAIETFKLLKGALNKEPTEEQMKTTKEKITSWNKAQYVRLFQQVLFAGAFGVSMAALTPALNTPTLAASENFAMAAANGIPFYMDVFWPFMRNAPIVVPKVEETA
ncbi:MAG: hypothetical protein COT85_03885 [Chlamydiae bacterium CG10_big_fil_rev_8_21_14_0_10_42_34]|nr:MAG: hypothetical protein COT85_03885 [Chlamydiae bacterium CG10_big_fil_rev_8_21_14_0_10_42_34]